jgi:hypothetical protein
MALKSVAILETGRNPLESPRMVSGPRLENVKLFSCSRKSLAVRWLSTQSEKI